MAGECDVCCGLGYYPIFDKFGSERYTITCPECDGCGLDDDGQELAAREAADRARYDAAMEEMRSTRPGGRT